ncbi:MAG: hypothetical protein JO316_10335 [Abitibacteriaceae bacterium]|nr:hypothetical protein [Abditibacteriaceae bacterium]
MKEAIHSGKSKEQVGDSTIGVRWELVMRDAVGVDIALFDLIAADDRQPQPCPKLPGQCGFPRSRLASDDDAPGFSVHVSEVLASILPLECGAGYGRNVL